MLLRGRRPCACEKLHWKASEASIGHLRHFGLAEQVARGVVAIVCCGQCFMLTKLLRAVFIVTKLLQARLRGYA